MEVLALKGPAHLSMVTIEPDATKVDVPFGPTDESLLQTFTYRRVKVTVGVHRPMDFLIPITLNVEHPDAIAAWVFNQMCQALMTAHSLRGHAVLALGIVVEDDGKGLSSKLAVHPVGHSGLLREDPLATRKSPVVGDFFERSPEEQNSVAVSMASHLLAPLITQTIAYMKARRAKR